MIGVEGQQRLARAHVWIIGCGALGCAASDQLVRAGVGGFTLIDRDIVELTNLQRQTLFTEHDLDEPKATAACARLRAIDDSIRLDAHNADCTPAFIERLLEAGTPDLILDGTDNFETRYLLNDVAVRERIPMVYAGVIGTRAMAMAILPEVVGGGPCLRCIAPTPPAPGTVETCDTAGVLAPAVQIAASMQVAEAMRILLGHADGSWLIEQDVWERTHRKVSMDAARDDECVCCAHGRYEFLDHRSAGKGGGLLGGGVLCGRGAVQISPPTGGIVDLDALGERLRAHGEVTVTEAFLRCVFSHEATENGEGTLNLMVFPDGRAIVRGTSDLVRARAVYARYIGT